MSTRNKSQCYFNKSGHIKPAFMTCFKESLVNSFAKLKHLSGPQLLLGPLTTGREFWKGHIVAHGDHNGLVSYLAHLSYKTYRREYIEQNVSCRFSQQLTCIRKNTPWKKFLEHLKYQGQYFWQHFGHGSVPIIWEMHHWLEMRIRRLPFGSPEGTGNHKQGPGPNEPAGPHSENND